MSAGAGSTAAERAPAWSHGAERAVRELVWLGSRLPERALRQEAERVARSWGDRVVESLHVAEAVRTGARR